MVILLKQKKNQTNIFSKIWSYFDRFIVMPITKLVLKITKKFDTSGKKFENWLSKSNTLLFVSLVIAAIIFLVIDQKVLKFSESSAEVLKGQAVTAIYNEEAYVIEGLPETVDITRIGSKADLYIARQSPTKPVTIDLSGLKPGTHKVSIKYDQASGSIEYNVNPSVATVIIYPKISETRTLTIDLLNQEALDSKKIIKNVTVDSDTVVIKGAEYQLKKVATVKALIDIKNLVKQEIGTTTLKDIPLKAYDELGNVVDVEIVPGKIDAQIEIASPSKELPIKIIPKGDVAFGKAISAITSSETKVTVYGTEEALAKLEYIPVEIDVQGLKDNHQFKLEVPKPVGVKSMTVNNVTVDVSLDSVSDRDVENVSIDVRNLNDQYIAQGVTEDDIKVIVNIKGVKSVLDQINSSDIRAYIDLSGYGEGIHEVEVKVEGDDARVQYVSKTKKVKVKIVKK